jgi:predicted nucleotidyltransferase
MNTAIDNKVKFYSHRLREKLGDNIKQIILFGSRARGECHEGSDYDFVIIVNERNKKVRETVTGVAVEFLNRYDELSANLIYNEEEWRECLRLPLGVNVQKEGITV